MGAKRRSVVVTGLGPITASGIGVEGLLAGLRAGCSPVAEVTVFDPAPFRSHMAAEVGAFDPAAFMDANECQTVITAARSAAGLATSEILERIKEAGARFRTAAEEKFRRSGEWK